MDSKIGIEINGVVFATEGNVDHDEFLNGFIKFVESKGWYFGGGTAEINGDDEGDADKPWGYAARKKAPTEG